MLFVQKCIAKRRYWLNLLSVLMVLSLISCAGWPVPETNTSSVVQGTQVHRALLAPTGT